MQPHSAGEARDCAFLTSSQVMPRLQESQLHFEKQDLLLFCFNVVDGGVQILQRAIILLVYRLEVASLEVNSAIFCLYESRVDSICLVSVLVYFIKCLIHFRYMIHFSGHIVKLFFLINFC